MSGVSRRPPRRPSRRRRARRTGDRAPSPWTGTARNGECGISGSPPGHGRRARINASPRRTGTSRSGSANCRNTGGPMSPSSEGHVRDDTCRAGTGRRLLGLAIAVVLGLLWLQPAMASAAPVDPQSVPQNLRLFVPDSAEWQTSPWMTSANCVDHGGDWSLYSSYLIKDMVDLLEFFQPNFGGSPDEANTPKRKPLIVKGYQDIAATLSAPGGYCVDLVKKWAAPNPSYKPFGFEWGNANNWGDHAVRPFSQCSGTDSLDKVAPCRGFYISCDGATSQQEHTSCEAWNAFSDDYVKRMNTVLTNAYTQYGIVVDGRNQTKTVIKSPAEVAQEFLNWVAKKGMEQVVSFIVSGVTKLWATFLRIAVD